MSELIDREAVREFIKSYRHSTDVAFDMEKRLDEIPAASQWHRVEEGLPDDEVPVLAMLHNTYGRNVVLKLCHIGHHKRTTEEYGWQEYEGETEYDEENDCFWIPEGWWESNYHEDNLNWEIDETDGTITHWMPLPEPPKEDA